MSMMLALGAAAGLAAGCPSEHTVRVEPVEVKPIHVTVDVNVRVDRELDEFFEFEQELEEGEPGGQAPEGDELKGGELEDEELEGGDLS